MTQAPAALSSRDAALWLVGLSRYGALPALSDDVGRGLWASRVAKLIAERWRGRPAGAPRSLGLAFLLLLVAPVLLPGARGCGLSLVVWVRGSPWRSPGGEMTDHENNNSISRNPFAALFSSVADARHFAEIQKQPPTPTEPAGERGGWAAGRGAGWRGTHVDPDRAPGSAALSASLEPCARELQAPKEIFAHPLLLHPSLCFIFCTWKYSYVPCLYSGVTTKSLFICCSSKIPFLFSHW